MQPSKEKLQGEGPDFKGQPRADFYKDADAQKAREQKRAEATEQRNEKLNAVRKFWRKIGIIALAAATTVGGIMVAKSGKEAESAKEDYGKRAKDEINSVYPNAEGVYASEDLISLNIDGVNYSFDPAADVESNAIVVEDGTARTNDENAQVLGKVEETMPLQQAMNDLQQQVKKNQ